MGLDVPSPLQQMGVTARAQVLLVGTFHFGFPGRDEHRSKHPVDMLSEERQAQIREVVNGLAAFRPTKVAVEVPLDQEAVCNDLYRAFRAGDHQLDVNEVEQLGFRLAERFGHERLWAIDAWGRFYEGADHAGVEAFAREHGQEDRLASPWDGRYERLYTHGDQLLPETTLREFLLYLNSEEVVRASHGHYLVGRFAVGDPADPRGVDFVTGWWYNRNLRIFRNIQRVTAGPADRIAVIIGAGHVPILCHCLAASPAHELHDVGEYLR